MGENTLEDNWIVSPEQFQLFADALSEPMLLVSDTGCIFAANRALSRHLNRGAETLRGKALTEITCDQSDRIDRYLHASARTSEPVLGALTLACADGEPRSFRAEAAVVRPKSAGAPAAILVRLADKKQTLTSFALLDQRIDRLTREIATRRRFEERHRSFMRDMLLSVTEGRLVLCEKNDGLPNRLQLFGHIPIVSGEQIHQLRRLASEAADSLGFSEAKRNDIVTAASEAAMNALVHAKDGAGSIYVSENRWLQTWIEDRGSGIAIENLPRVTLERGFTTAGTLGHGFKLILETADIVWLHTNEHGTTVVVGHGATPTAIGFNQLATP